MLTDFGVLGIQTTLYFNTDLMFTFIIIIIKDNRLCVHCGQMDNDLTASFQILMQATSLVCEKLW